MKKAIFLSILLSAFVVLGANAAVVYSSDVNKNKNAAADDFGAGVLCNKKRTRCTVGKYVMQGSVQHPLYVRDGIVCNYKRTRCTNGYTMQSSSKPQY